MKNAHLVNLIGFEGKFLGNGGESGSICHFSGKGGANYIHCNLLGKNTGSLFWIRTSLQALIPVSL